MERKPWEMTTSIEEHIKELIKNAERDLVNAKVQEHMFQLEYAKPKNIGKEEAMQGIATYQKRQRYLEDILFAYAQYCNDKLKP